MSILISIILTLLLGLLILTTLLLSTKKSLKHRQQQLEEKEAVINSFHSINIQSQETLDHAEKRYRITTALLNETKEYLNSIINSMPSILIGVTPTAHITHWNDAAEIATGIPEKKALGFRLHEVYPEITVDIESIENTIANNQPYLQESVKIEDELGIRYFDITVYPLRSLELSGAVIRVDDVTLRQKLDSMLMQNEKLKSLGELAAGMAHEINNPLAAILQSLQNIRRRLDPSLPANTNIAEQMNVNLMQTHQYLEQRDILRFLDGMQTAGNRAAEIVRNMLEFSRHSNRELEPSSINDIVENSVAFIKNALELSMPEFYPTLTIKKSLTENLPLIPASSLEIQQVLVNLLKNAAQAIQEAKPEIPLISISTELENKFVIIKISDNGIGMNKLVSKQIFDPFFTTKAVGQGTGLGLSISHFIINQRHHGYIEVQSIPGQGTTFTIKIPLQNH